MVPDWFRFVIVTGLQKLLALRLTGTPPEDAIVGTAEVWLEAIWDRGCRWEEHLDRERMERAFLVLFRTCDRWPPPKLFLDNIGARAPPRELPPPPVSQEVRERNMARIRELMEDLKKSIAMKEPHHGKQEKGKSGAVGVPEQGTDG